MHAVYRALATERSSVVRKSAAVADCDAIIMPAKRKEKTDTPAAAPSASMSFTRALRESKALAASKAGLAASAGCKRSWEGAW